MIVNCDAVYDGTGEKEVQAMKDQTQKLVNDGLENKLLSVLQDLLSCTYPENMVCTLLKMNELLCLKSSIIMSGLLRRKMVFNLAVDLQYWCLILKVIITS